MLLTCFATFGAALLYLIVAVPTFTAAAKLVIDAKGTPRENAASVSTMVESQIVIIKSEGLARAVIQKLGLAKDPEFAGQAGGVRDMIRSISWRLGWSKPETEFSVMRRAVESFDRKLSAKRLGSTYIVELTFDSVDPERVAQVLNTLAETYIMAQMDAKYRSASQSDKWVKDRTNELSSKASAAKKALADYYKNRNGIADSTGAPDADIPPSQLTPSMQGEPRELEAAAESTARNYDNFLHGLRYMEAMQQQSLPVFDAQLLTEASRPLRASSPKVGIVLVISTVGGALLGIAVGMLRDLLDRGIRTRGQVWRELQIACITVVPRVKSNGAKRALSSPRSTVRPRSKNIVRTENPIWTVTDAPQSRFTESFFLIKIAKH
jgi:uncharacterized protein involved in exopolysaccharide biosynthesis